MTAAPLPRKPAVAPTVKEEKRIAAANAARIAFFILNTFP
jgi:hypothetical protein